MDGSPGVVILEHAESIIYHSCDVKRKIVARMSWIMVSALSGTSAIPILDTLIEATAGYGQVMHGEAVAIGMVQVSRVAEKQGLPCQLGITLQSVCVRNLACQITSLEGECSISSTDPDKKVRGNSVSAGARARVG